MSDFKDVKVVQSMLGTHTENGKPHWWTIMFAVLFVLYLFNH